MSVGFLSVGVVGLQRLSKSSASFADALERWPYTVFLASVVAVGFGSVHYHLAPRHGSLFWDRLPMRLAFMSLLSAVLVERLGPRVGLRLFPWLAAAGWISGHTLKHVLAAVAAAWLLRMRRLRSPAAAESAP